MPVFQVTALADNKDAIQRAIESNFSPEDRYPLQGEAGWLVRHKGTTTEVSNHLGITGQPQGEKSPIGSAMVTLVGNYYGRGPTDMWEWLKTRFEGTA